MPELVLEPSREPLQPVENVAGDIDSLVIWPEALLEAMRDRVADGFAF